MEQIVDDPVPSGGGRRRCRRRIRIWPKLTRTEHETLAGSRPEQSSTAFGAAEHETLAGSRPGQSSTAFGAAEHETLAGFLPGQGSPAFDGTQFGFLPGSSSTASHEAEHLGFLRCSSSPTFGGADHHGLGFDVGDEDEEEEEISRFPPHFRPRLWCVFVHSGLTCPRGWQCTFAHHESELHPDSW